MQRYVRVPLVLVRSARVAVASVLAAVQLIGCAGGSGPPPHSNLIDLTLPAGTTPSPPPERGQRPADEESWDLHQPYADAVAAIGKRLPLHHDLDGVPWCDENEEEEPRVTSWLWEKVGEKIEIDISGGPSGSGVTITHDRFGQHKCVPWPHPGPSQLSTAGAAMRIGVWFEPTALTFSAGSNKLYVDAISPKDATYAVSMSAMTTTPSRLNDSIADGIHQIAVNNKLRLGYALAHTGALRVFNTDSDTLVASTEPRSCKAEVLAVNEASSMVYGGGLSATGECVVKFDSAGHFVEEKDVAPASGKENRMIQRIAVDPASGDVIYMDPYSVGRADPTLTEKWRTPAPGVSRSKDIYSGPAASDMGYEPSSATVYVCVSPTSIVAPATIAVYDGRTGKQTGQFTSPGSSTQFAADQEDRLFVAFANSSDLYVLANGAKSPAKFETLVDVQNSSPTDIKWLAVNSAAHQLFVSPGSGNSVYRYSY
jgi:hypothetical protein